MSQNLKQLSKRNIILISISSVAFVLSILIALGAIFLFNRGKDELEISTLSITYNGNEISTFNAEVFEDDLQFGVVINNGQTSDFQSPKITWEFVGESLNSTVDNDGNVKIGNTLGNVLLSVVVEGKNKMSTNVPITISKKTGTQLKTLSASLNDGFSTTYVEGQIFNKNSISVVGNFGEYDAFLSVYELSDAPLQKTTTDILVQYDGQSFSFPITVQKKTLQSIEIAKQPTKTIYIEGQCFNKDGMIVLAKYEYTSEEISTYFVNETTKLEKGTTEVEIFFTHDGITKSCKQEIIVNCRTLNSITLNCENVKKEYIQGEMFDKTGLVVTANFEEVESEIVNNFSFNKSPLIAGTTNFEISYSENGIKKVAQITDIVVSKPYSKKQKITISCPEDISLNWIYSYVDDNGNSIIDNCEYEENGLTYDTINGIYVVPVGAIVTIMSNNPSILDFSFDGQEQNTLYPNNTKIWKIESETDLLIQPIYIPGEHVVIKFAGSENSQSFMYGNNWNAPLKTQDLALLLNIFKDTKTYYYTFVIGEDEYTAVQIASVSFNETTKVNVVKKQIVENLINLKLNYFDEFNIEVAIETDSLLSSLPVPNRVCYEFSGWALTEEGSLIDQTEFSTYINNGSINHNLFAVWTLKTRDFSGETIVGEWKCKTVSDLDEIVCIVEFNSNSTFTYTVQYNGAQNNSCFGIYNIIDNQIVIEEIDSNDSIIFVTAGIFEFVLSGGELQGTVFFVENYVLSEIFESFEKNV